MARFHLRSRPTAMESRSTVGAYSLLPFVGEQELYDQIDTSKPWDDPVNIPFHNQMPDIYCCAAIKYHSKWRSTGNTTALRCRCRSEKPPGVPTFHRHLLRSSMLMAHHKLLLLSNQKTTESHGCPPAIQIWHPFLAQLIFRNHTTGC